MSSTMKNAIKLPQEVKCTTEGIKYNRIFPSKLSTSAFLEVYILFLFRKKSSYYGKEIMDEIEDAFGSKWKPSHGMMYPLLRKLEDAGYLVGEWEDEDKKSKRMYKITEEGNAALQKELRDKENMFIDSYNMIVKILNDLYSHNKPFMINRK